VDDGCRDDCRGCRGNRRRYRGGEHALTAFGLDSVIKLASPCVLIWRLDVELRHG
jgi:hypothetical protein